jgi:hypothetical protein
MERDRTALTLTAAFTSVVALPHLLITGKLLHIGILLALHPLGQ